VKTCSGRRASTREGAAADVASGLAKGCLRAAPPDLCRMARRPTPPNKWAAWEIVKCCVEGGVRMRAECNVGEKAIEDKDESKVEEGV
jgi:hypothetical protein